MQPQYNHLLAFVCSRCQFVYLVSAISKYAQEIQPTFKTLKSESWYASGLPQLCKHFWLFHPRVKQISVDPRHILARRNHFVYLYLSLPNLAFSQTGLRWLNCLSERRIRTIGDSLFCGDNLCKCTSDDIVMKPGYYFLVANSTQKRAKQRRK